ncbi:MAG: RNA polymerase subunit sigma [Oscillospiraceae bacterium]|nr:RNA polymerase subunit sigma [Oscillospiraceae bacterium]
MELVLGANYSGLDFEELVRENKRWILTLASRTCGRFITESDDEWSIALMAFNEAVEGFDGEKGSFRSIASVVIRRRLTDYMRSEGRHSAELTVRPAAFEGELEEDESGALELSVRQRVAEVSMADDSGAKAHEEIAEMQEILSEYGFSFFDLAEASPKAEKTKRSCGTAIRTLVASVILMAAMRLRRLLPVKELSEKSGVVRKILDRHRKYIIASAEILDGDFPILASYLSYVKEENG